MSKPRKIMARGLTASDRGKVIEYRDVSFKPHKVRVDSVGYEEGKTVITFTTTVRIPNMLEIEVFDK